MHSLLVLMTKILLISMVLLELHSFGLLLQKMQIRLIIIICEVLVLPYSLLLNILNLAFPSVASAMLQTVKATSLLLLPLPLLQI